MISPSEAATQMIISDTATHPQIMLTGPPPTSGYVSVVARPYGIDARTKDMKATCSVDRFRASSGL